MAWAVTELSIGQVAKRTGISARMLRHYDELGLFRPTRVSQNGYRWYDVAALPRLYRVIALRRAGIGLPEIAGIVADQSDEAGALRAHLTELRAEHQRLSALIASIEEQIERLEDSRITEPDSFRADYEHELADFAQRLESAHPGAGAHALAHTRPEMLSATDMEHLAAHGTAVLERLAALMSSGASIDDPATLDMIADHYSSINDYVALPLRAYRVLGQLYETDPLQRSIVAGVHPDLPGWIAKAIDAFVNSRCPV